MLRRGSSARERDGDIPTAAPEPGASASQRILYYGIEKAALDCWQFGWKPFARGSGHEPTHGPRRGMQARQPRQRTKAAFSPWT